MTDPVFAPIDGFVGNSHCPTHQRARPCPLCGGTRQRLAVELADFQFFSDSASVAKRVHICQVMCRDCFTLFANPVFTASGFAALFAEAGMSYGATEARPQEQIDWLAARDLLTPGRVFLDVGCYDGRFLSKLPVELVRQGVDIDGPAIARGRQRDPALELIHGDFESFAPSRAPQVITLFHVLEHLPDPLAVLRRLRSVAADDVQLVVEVPVVEGGQTNDINGFFSVQHLTHFSRHSLAGALALSGWRVVEAEAKSGYNGYRVRAVKAPIMDRFIGDPGDIAHLQRVLRAWTQAQCAVEAKLSPLAADATVVVWGAGLHTEFLYQVTSLFAHSYRRFVLVDGDPLKQGTTWRGLPVYSPAMLSDLDWNRCRLVISSYGSQPSMLAAAESLGVPGACVYSLYDQVNVY